MSSSEPRAAAETKKISDIKNLHPSMYKKTEFLVTVTIRKIGNSWWYNACKKCFRTAKPHGDSYRCSDGQCSFVGTPTQRYKLCVLVGDETGDIDFILFRRMAQRLTKKAVDVLIANNPLGFIPDEITKLLERVNAVVHETGAANATIPMSPYGSKTSSLMLSQGHGNSAQNTPHKMLALTQGSPSSFTGTSQPSASVPGDETALIPMLPVMPRASGARGETEAVASPGDAAAILPPPSTDNTKKSNSRKRLRPSGGSKAAKKMFPE